MQLLEKNLGEYAGASKLHFALYLAAVFLFSFLAGFLGEAAVILLELIRLAIVLHLGWGAKGRGYSLGQAAFLGLFFGLLTTILYFALTLLLLGFGQADTSPEFFSEVLFTGFVVNPVLGLAICLIGSLAGTYYSRWVMRKRDDGEKTEGAQEIQKNLPRAARRRMEK